MRRTAFLLLFILSAGLSHAGPADHLHAYRGDMQALSDTVSANWLTRNWYYDQRLFGGNHLWLAYGARNAEQKSKGSRNGFGYHPLHIAAGYDHSFRNLSLGGVFMSHQGNFSGPDRAEIKGKAFALYGSWSPKPWYIAGAVYSDFFDTKGRSFRYDARAAGAGIEAGYEFRPVNGLRLTPYMGAKYSYISSGAHEAAAKSFGALDWEYAEMLAGLKGTYAIKTGWGQLIAKAGAAYSRSLGSEIPGASWTENAVAYKEKNINTSRDAFILTGGLELMEFYATLTVHLDYRGEYRPAYRDHKVGVSVHLRF